MARIIKASKGLKFSQNTELTQEDQERLNRINQEHKYDITS
jgi:hypothetical protein